MKTNLILLTIVLFAACPSFGFFPKVKNPAEVVCEGLGGALKDFEDVKGLKLTFCQFGHALIEVWTLHRQMNGEKTQAVETYFNPRPFDSYKNRLEPIHSNCAAQGGRTNFAIANWSNRFTSICEFPDDSIIEQWTLYTNAGYPHNWTLSAILNDTGPYKF